MADESKTPPAEDVNLLRREVSRLKEELAALEKQLPSDEQVASATKSGSSDAAPISDELLLIISSAIAAYLGVKPHIRQIRLVANMPWAQQGRITIQASHVLAHRQS